MKFLCSCGRNWFVSESRARKVCVCGKELIYGCQATPQPSYIYQRKVICSECMYCLNNENCGILMAQDKPGYLMHPLGIPNPLAHCPIGKWGPQFSGKVGFLVVSYMHIGGTETWHHTLLKQLENVAGFVCLDPKMLEGDLSRLPCPTGTGLKDAVSLARSCEVLVVWGIGKSLDNVLSQVPKRPRIISVSHCSSKSEWTTEIMNQQARWTDTCVYLCDTGKLTCPQDKPNILIHNAPDPARITTTIPRETIRQGWGISAEDKLAVTFARLSPEKNVDLLMDAVALLPQEYKFIVAGASNKWTDKYDKQVRSKSGGRIRIIQAVESPAELLAAADVYLSASEFEGYGLSTAEAMLAGVSVISTPTGLLEAEPHLARIVHHGATAEEWAKAIVDDFRYVDWKKERVDTARKTMQTSHSVERFAKSWQDLIDGPVDLSDVTFLLPVRYDTPHRLENLELTLHYLRHHLKTNILVTEDGPVARCSHLASLCNSYEFIQHDTPSIYRTRMLNKLAKKATTPYIALYDTDVLLKKQQYQDTATCLRSGIEMVYPYSGNFITIPRTEYKEVRATLSTDYVSLGSSYAPSYGGAVFYNRESFLQIGGENERMRMWGYEDNERYVRATTMGLSIHRVDGAIYHIEHDRLANGQPFHEEYENNRKELERISSMDKRELTNEIRKWYNS